jgi:hypothetical protein
MRTVRVTKYLTPLREGGSVPAVVEADDQGVYVLKFRGAAQGPRALIAELVAGEIGRALGLPVPEIVLAELDPLLARSEPDPELQQLIQASGGLNLALDFLPGALAYDPLLDVPDADLASRIVWFDAALTNVDRTARNTNMLMWHRRLYLIDHGAALFFHHTWGDYQTRSQSRFPQVRDHVLLPSATQLREADAALSPQLSPELLGSVVAQIPDEWLGDEPRFASPDEHRAAYVDYLIRRTQPPRAFVEEAIDARAQLA